MTGLIDFTKRFIPEHLTPLFHTPAYTGLSPAQRLRYNQLHASYLNEQTIFFESAMAQHILRGFSKQKPPAGLADGLRTFAAEETEHSAMFRALNRQCLPNYYSRGDFHFIRLAQWASFSLGLWVRHPGLFPFFLWVLLIQEERALFYAKEFLAAADTLEPNFVAAQRRHLTDEVGHIRWDEQLLDWAWPRASPWRRRINARLFAWMMGEYFTTPRRSGVRVVAELINEFPELSEQWPSLHDQMLGLSSNRDFNRLSYSRAVTPKAFARFDGWPEFKSLGRVLPGYEPLPVPAGSALAGSPQR